MASIFTKIIDGEIPCYKLFEDDRVFSFLDINPVSEGHALVIPKKEVDYIFDVEDDLIQHLFLISKKIGKAIEQTVECERVSIAVVGLEVPHAHVHLIPIKEMSDFSFSNQKLSLSEDQFKDLATRIRAKLLDQ